MAGYSEGEKLGRCLRRLNGEIADGCALELACSPSPRDREAGQGRRDAPEGDAEDNLVLLGVLSTGAVAVVPVVPAPTSRRRLLSLSDSIAECAMLLGLGTSLYGLSVRPGE